MTATYTAKSTVDNIEFRVGIGPISSDVEPAVLLHFLLRTVQAAMHQVYGETYVIDNPLMRVEPKDASDDAYSDAAEEGDDEGHPVAPLGTALAETLTEAFVNRFGTSINEELLFSFFEDSLNRLESGYGF